MANKIDDISLFKQIQSNNKSAFDILFRKYYTPLCRYAVQILRDPDESEETVQDIFVNLWTHRAQLNITKSLASYLFTSVRYRAFTFYRKESARKEHEKAFADGLDQTDIIISDEPDHYDVSIILNEAIEKLPDKCREIFTMSREQHLTYKQIAEQLDISIKTVETQMGIAFKKLRKELSSKLNREKLSLVLLVL